MLKKPLGVIPTPPCTGRVIILPITIDSHHSLLYFTSIVACLFLLNLEIMGFPKIVMEKQKKAVARGNHFANSYRSKP